MEEKKVIKIKLSTLFLFIAIIAIGVMVYFIFKLNDEKTKATEQVNELNSQINSLENKVNSLQVKNENVLNATTSNNNDSNIIETNKNITSFSEEQVKKVVSDYLELQASILPLQVLKEKGKLADYDSDKSKLDSNNGKITTNVKFDDYKNAMLNYVTESEFEKNWISKAGLEKDSNGYVTHGQLGGGVRNYTINSISRIDDKTFLVKTTSMVENDNSTKSNNDFTVTVKSYNGNCVIDSVK